MAYQTRTKYELIQSTINNLNTINYKNTLNVKSELGRDGKLSSREKIIWDLIQLDAEGGLGELDESLREQLLLI